MRIPENEWFNFRMVLLAINTCPSRTATLPLSFAINTSTRQLKDYSIDEQE
jgi:hypothetical protein